MADITLSINFIRVRTVYLTITDNRPLAKIIRTGKMPIPEELFFLVGWASCPSHQLRKRIFARGLMSKLTRCVSPESINYGAIYYETNTTLALAKASPKSAQRI